MPPTKTRHDHPSIRWTLGFVLPGLTMLLGAVPARAQPPADTATAQAVAAETATADAPRVATLVQLDSAQETTPRRLPARAPLLAPNPKLSGVSCSGITVIPTGLSAHVFADGFESGGVQAWTPANGTLFARAFTDLEIRIHLAGFEGEALLSVDLTSPRGHHFQRLEAPVAAGSPSDGSSATSAPEIAARTAGLRTLPGYPHPVQLRAVLDDADGIGKAGVGQTTTMTWPIAGTHVVSHGLYGTWSVAASLSSGPGEQPLVTCPATQLTLRP